MLTYAVSRRRKEFGVRTALGASPANIRHLVLRDGLLVTAVCRVCDAAAAATCHLNADDGARRRRRRAHIHLRRVAAAAQAVRVDPARLLREGPPQSQSRHGQVSRSCEGNTSRPSTEDL